MTHKDESSLICSGSSGAVVTGILHSGSGNGLGNSFLICVDDGSICADLTQQGLCHSNALKLVAVLVQHLVHLVVLCTVHQMGGLHDQVLHAVCHSAVQCLLHVVDLLTIACLHMVDDDLRGKGAAHAPVGVCGLQGVLNALDVGSAAVVEGGAEGHHQQLVLADLIGVAGIVLGSIAGVAAKVVGVGVLALHQLLLGIGQSVPSGLCGFALGIGVIGALLHIDGVDQVCHVLCGQCVSVCAGSLAASGRTGSNRAYSAGSSPAAAGQYTGAQSQSGQSGRRFADVAFFHLVFLS